MSYRLSALKTSAEAITDTLPTQTNKLIPCDQALAEVIYYKLSVLGTLQATPVGNVATATEIDKLINGCKRQI